MTRRRIATIAAVAGAAALVAAAPGITAGPASEPTGLEAMPDPVDPQSWVLPEWMSWDDYRPIPGVDWTDPSHQPPRKIRAALILGDFQDREFIVTQPQNSDPFGGVDGQPHNPQGIGSVPREEVADWYADFLIREPGELNHGHTVNEYWLEDSYGLVGVDADAFGPYRMDGKEHEYGFAEWGQGSACPPGDDCARDFDTELVEASLADVTTGIATNGGRDYDFRYLLHAGYDESGVWQEFGEMMFPNRDSVPDAFGGPDPDAPNWAPTRYIDWTSFAAAKGIWSHAIPGTLSTQGESDGHSTFAHELSHIFGVLDNYNNPYGNPLRRSYTGTWAQLSRGTFNGPGGTHNRWQVPPTQGGTMGSHHMLRNKLRLGFMKPNEVLFTSRDVLEQTGPAFATIYPRAYPLAPVTGDIGLHGMVVQLPEDRSDCDSGEYDCDRGGYNNYTVEFVDRIGMDSFTTDSGILLAKNKDAVDLPPFMWAIDAHPGDINEATPPPPNDDKEIYDFVRPGTGEKVDISLGDARQLADALFHAGTGEGVVSEYVDEANGLHFYVLEKNEREDGVATYRVAVRALDGDNPGPRGVGVGGPPAASASPGRVARVDVDVTNTGLTTDLVRLTVETTDGWATAVQHEVLEVPAGTRTVPVFVAVPEDADGPTELTVTAASETDVEATASTTITVGPDGGTSLAGLLPPSASPAAALIALGALTMLSVRGLRKNFGA